MTHSSKQSKQERDAQVTVTASTLTLVALFTGILVNVASMARSESTVNVLFAASGLTVMILAAFVFEGVRSEAAAELRELRRR